MANSKPIIWNAEWLSAEKASRWWILLCNAWLPFRRASFLHTLLQSVKCNPDLHLISRLQMSGNKLPVSLGRFAFLWLHSSNFFFPFEVFMEVVYCCVSFPTRQSFLGIDTLSAAHLFTFIQSIEFTLGSCSWLTPFLVGCSAVLDLGVFFSAVIHS